MEITKLVQVYRCSEDFTRESDSLYAVYDNGDIKQIYCQSTSSDSPEDNSLGRIGIINIGKIIGLVKENPNLIFESIDSDDPNFDLYDL